VSLPVADAGGAAARGGGAGDPAPDPAEHGALGDGASSAAAGDGLGTERLRPHAGGPLGDAARAGAGWLACVREGGAPYLLLPARAPRRRPPSAGGFVLSLHQGRRSL